MPGQDQDKCIDEITEDDIMLKLLCRYKNGNGGEHGHDREAGKVAFSEREI